MEHARTCSECDKPLDHRTQGDLCRECRWATAKGRPRCANCSGVLRYENRSGYCADCRRRPRGPLMPLSDFEIGWLAGAFDSDGCITMNKSGQSINGREYVIHRGIVQIGLVDVEPIDWLAAVFPGHRHLVPAGRGMPNALPQYRWHASDGQAVPLLELIAPHLRIKKRQAEIVLELQESKNRYGRTGLPEDVFERREELYREIRRLNQREHLRTERPEAG